MKVFSYLVIMSIFSLPAISQNNKSRKLDELVSAYASQGKFNGSVLVAQRGEILLKKGYGIRNSSKNSKNDSATVFQIASITKQFTAVIILRLVELNKMSLSDRLSKYYSGFPNGDSITIENLLTHTSGIHNFTEDDTSIVETDEGRMIPYLRKLRPDFAPGTSWHYSNSGYVLLGYIIQKVSGMSYWQAVRSFIFTPLHMNNSGFDFTHLLSNEKAMGYDQLNDSVQQPANATDSTVPFAAGSIYSTVGDMYKWHRALQEYKIVGGHLMERAYTPCTQHNYGFGWQIDSVFGKKMVSHSGSISGFGSNFARIVSDDVCIVMLSNISGSTFELTHLTDKLLAVLYDKPYQIPVKRTPVKLAESVLNRYVGTYEIDTIHVIIDMTVENGVLIARPHQGPTAVMVAMDERRFYIENDNEVEIAFDLDASQKVKGVEIFQNGTKRYAKKIK